MGFSKYANATVAKSSINLDGWDEIRQKTASLDPSFDVRTAAGRVVLQEYKPEDFLLSHCTIVASVDSEEPVGALLGRQMVDGEQIDRKYSDYYVTPETTKYINNNCFVAGTMILMADGTEKPIERVVVGDSVVSHTGAVRKVVETFAHPFRGYLRSIKRLGDHRALDVTPEHPFWAMVPATTCACGCGTPLDRRDRKAAIHRFQDYVRGHGAKPRKNPKPDYTWVSAGFLNKGDFLSMPLLQGEVAVEGITSGKARLLGYYIAEGFYHRQKPHRVSQVYRDNEPSDRLNVPVGVNFALNLDETDTLVAEIQYLLKSEFGIDSSVARTSEGGVTVYSNQSLPLVQFLQRHATEYAKTKKLLPHVLQWPLDLQREVVRGWMEGDGCLEGTAGGWVSIASASSDLISQMHVILGRLGIFAARNSSKSIGRKRVRVANGGIKIVDDPTKTTVSNWLQIGSVFAEKLMGGSFLEQLYRRSVHNRIREDRTMFPIRSVAKKKFEGTVYNFETETDHSYVANGVAVHNSDAWERKLLLASFRTFIGGENYCFVPGTMIVMGDGTQKPIEQVRIGDEVVTHKGMVRQVTHTFKREVQEELSVLYFDRYKEPVKATGNHPFRKLEVRTSEPRTRASTRASSAASYQTDALRKDIRDAGGPFATEGVLTSDTWVRADSLRPGDHILGPDSARGQEGGSSEFYQGKRVHKVAFAGRELYQGPVFNFEVEEDHSYVLGNGVAVHNCEHIQIPELSKGKIIDAAARDIGDSVYVDILVATDRKHKSLIASIESGQLNTLSMGAQVAFTICTKCGNVAEDELQLCRHIKYQKGNFFIDPMGKRRKIAELCGHVTSEPGSCRFIEGSWVANPAFTGAVLRNILDPRLAAESAEIKNKIQVAFSQPARTVDPSALQKAAKLAPIGVGAFAKLADNIVSQFAGVPSLGALEAPRTDSNSTGAEIQRQARLRQIANVVGERQNFEAQDPTTPDEGKAGPLDKSVKDIKDTLVERVTDQIKDDLSKEDQEGIRKVLDENETNESLIKSAMSSPEWKDRARKVVRMASGNLRIAKTLLAGLVLFERGGWSAVASSRRFTGAEILAISRATDRLTKKASMAGESRVYRTVIAVGGTAPYSNVDNYLEACRKVVGRDLTESEKIQLIFKGQLYSLGR